MPIRLKQCPHCLRDDDEWSAHPCRDGIEYHEACAAPYYDANGLWQTSDPFGATSALAAVL